MAFDKPQKRRTEKAGKVLRKKILPERREVKNCSGGDFVFQTCKRNEKEVKTFPAEPEVHTFAVAKANCSCIVVAVINNMKLLAKF